ncbi:DNA replication factor C, large subunit [Dothidotthia symphoricarpi CBS 119687]|uniref:Replication factor C subunit 1 n=1 Tax=Dothidotthia symphoricarpi CBS 119687 TaxID=1392245 RepID=A0A6A6AIU1_9PLEO|nr:DNA replication factor C, large subunit [Dothidotthia symphoricarpi CBS 119687]KAF2130824.1 DNA replication factor C, large subunit [Dothidotthia symphoricarpi CBS 119687]
MPADIRNFFGGGPKASQGSGSQNEEKVTKKAAPKKTSRAARVVVDDSDDDEEADVKPKKATPKKPPPKKVKREPTPELEETTTSAFFASSNKPKRSDPVKTKPAETPKATPKEPPAKANGQGPKPTTSASNGRASGRAKKPITSYAEKEGNDEFPDDDLEDAEDIFGANVKAKDDYVELADSDDEQPVRLPHRGTPKAPAKQQKKIKDEDDFDPENADEDVDMKDVDADNDFVVPDEEEQVSKSKPKKTSAASRKRKSPELDDDDDEEEDEKPKKSRAKKTTPAKSPAKKKAKKEEVAENADIQAIYDSIATVRAPTPPPKDPNAKFDFRANAGRSEPAPLGGSSGEMPSGSESCLAGLNFVFTGVLQKWGRTEAQELVKRHGGKVTGAPSKKTSFVVLGEDAGPSKLQKIRDMSIKTINEDGLADLIEKLTAAGNQGDSKAQAAYQEKQRKEEEAIKKQAAEIEKEEKRRVQELKAVEAAAGRKSNSADTAATKSTEPEVDSRLWTTKYAPTSLNQICGNKATVEKIQRWLQRFPKNLKTGFKLAGPDGSGVFRAVMLHGPPGIGKTTAAHLVAKLEGYDIVERNASDTRSKKLIEEGLRGVLSTNSLHGYFAGDGKKVDASKKKLVFIMDEVDGMSAGDRGGVGALAAVCKKTEIPMILICNDRKLPKMKPFDFVTYDLPFRRPTVDQVRSRIMTIAYREGLKMPAPVINALIEGSHADIRQVVNMISTAKLDEAAMDFDKGKQMSKNWEKHVILKPWDITQKILGGGMFAASSKATLNEKIELYFNDHEFSPLMLQENYLGTNPMQALNYSGKEKNLKMLELASNAADSISDGDLVDRMIHGSQQQWSLMPTHAVFSFVRPASFVAGSTAGNQTRFTSWLGKNSSTNKLSRMVKEIQAHMRLRSSGDRHEVRQQYIPVLWTELVQKLQKDGKDAVPAIIDLMDSYFLTKDDFDAIMELGVGFMDQEKIKIETQAKATFTRLYNQQSHPLPFMKATSVVAPKKQAKEKPDLEEAIEESDDGEVIEEVKEEDEEGDLSKDKYVKQPKKKAAGKKAAPKKAAKKKAKDDEDEDEDEDDEVKPKAKGKGKAAAKGKKK